MAVGALALVAEKNAMVKARQSKAAVSAAIKTGSREDIDAAKAAQLEIVSQQTKLEARYKRKFVNHFCGAVQRWVGVPPTDARWRAGEAEFTEEEVLRLPGREHWSRHYERTAAMYVAEARLVLAVLEVPDPGMVSLASCKNQVASWMTLNGQDPTLAHEQANGSVLASYAASYARSPELASWPEFVERFSEEDDEFTFD